MKRRSARPVALAAVVMTCGLVTATACSGPPTAQAPPATTAATGTSSGGGQTVGSALQAAATATEDVVTPLLVSTSTRPIPVKGADNRFHVAYELQILNSAPRAGTLSEIETVADGTGRTVAALDAAQIASRTVAIGELRTDATPVDSVGAGRTVVVLVDDTYATSDEIPATFHHRVKARFAAPEPGFHPFAEKYPDQVDQVTPTVALGDGKPVRIGAPLRGTNWMAGNSCCELSPHRGALLALNGRLNATERYAIDFLMLNPEQLADPSKMPNGADLPSVNGDPAQQKSYLAYDQPLLAVADAKVAAISDGAPDAEPQVLTRGLTIQELGGNYVILDLGNSTYAFYAHVVNGSFTVKVGDEVKEGAVIGRLGNSGNSSEAHLHFHVSRGPTPLASDQVPYVFESFTAQGSLSGPPPKLDTTVVPAGPRTDELPLTWNVVDFPT